MNTIGPKMASDNPIKVHVIYKNGTEFIAIDQNGQPVCIPIEDLLKVANIDGAATQEDMDEIELIVSSLASGSPKGVYATLALLEAAYPTGTTGIFVVQSDGNWYYWDGAAWTAGGAYLGNQVSDGTDTWSETHSIQYVDGEPFFVLTLSEV